jgi:hypothetical protein
MILREQGSETPELLARLAQPEGQSDNAVECSRLPPKVQAMEGVRFRHRRRSAPEMPSHVGAGKRNSVMTIDTAIFASI